LGKEHSPHIPERIGTAVVAGVVEIYVIDPAETGWRVLVLQRASDTIRAGSWETVFGKIDPGEVPEVAALRELEEETGLKPARLYNVTVQPFYLHSTQTVQLAIVFAAFVEPGASARVSVEHSRAEWLPVDAAVERFTWPRAGDALRDIRKLLGDGTAGTVEDVLRIR